MPYTIPDPLNLDYEDQLPVGHYTTYIPWYGPKLSSEYVPFSFRVIGYTKTGAMKMTADSSRYRLKEKFTRTRKNGHFMIPTANEGHEGKQISEIFPYHKSVKQQKYKETHDHVKGETIIFRR